MSSYSVLLSAYRICVERIGGVARHFCCPPAPGFVLLLAYQRPTMFVDVFPAEHPFRDYKPSGSAKYVPLEFCDCGGRNDNTEILFKNKPAILSTCYRCKDSSLVLL